MKFSRVGDHTIKCIISEQEIDAMGFSIDEIMSNGARTQEFMNQIFDLAEQQFQTKFDMGIKTVRADFLPDHTVSLTFSEHPASGISEHLKDIVNSLLGSIPQEKWEEMKQAAAQGDTPLAGGNIIVAVCFDGMDPLLHFVGQIPQELMPPSALYKLDETFYLVLDLSACSTREVERLSMITDEFADDLLVGAERIAHVAEHGKKIIGSDAIAVLCNLASE